jgi:hypothetical protein
LHLLSNSWIIYFCEVFITLDARRVRKLGRERAIKDWARVTAVAKVIVILP